ncbi:MAG: ABC transporter ATP-binding protein [Mesorhizobium sp.]|uniref:ABC transporter ATP-binding protein n=1 Tax=Mesorhizobium sp. TaxID=1871066 RepID=UPI000FE50317|nr:ABC transporter ATP-binding protein [Mesorhizobium sp.]RWI32351.1 MAG: ABC transporter ATP-binding protein [Mesorhizobium sp.]RWI62824.1 MAG: ABC transporter ATP-binding protein [Mesorhizobium sp.]RWI80364.1 MAG: ABC transporter ATP-binding protein [Mesorhizobium sp.]RWJ46760.1 MAG: ABC transporter ATP-binding protein [Mesorhizobium sp.]RWJ56673.1 MAG: ABC transporter ATP-binding protein [Mesorhizobium sp.]
MKGSSVTVSEIVKQYGAVTAVDGVSVDVQPGEFLSLLGPSGSGKTTLLMMIAGFELPSSGVIRVGATDVTHVAPNKRNIGMVFQKYALFPHMSVRENISFPLRMRKAPKAEIHRRVGEAIDLVHLGSYGDRKPSQLSGGQQQRVALARALVFEPPVLLMDEPLGALDKKLREQLQIEIKTLQQRLGVTVIFVTHDQEEALTMSDRIAVMDDGRVAQIGAPSDLYANPSTPFVAEFIGKMNFLVVDYLGEGPAGSEVRLHDTASFTVARRPGETARFSEGARLVAAVRPESITVRKRGTGAPEGVSGTVATSIYLGTHQTLLVDLDGREGPPIHVQLPVSHGSQTFARGETVDLSFRPEAIHLFARGTDQ